MGRANDLIDYLAIWFISWRIRKGWGGDCDVLDYNDLKEKKPETHELNATGRCGSCQAKEVLQWLARWRSLNADIKNPPIQQGNKE